MQKCETMYFRVEMANDKREICTVRQCRLSPIQFWPHHNSENVAPAGKTRAIVHVNISHFHALNHVQDTL